MLLISSMDTPCRRTAAPVWLSCLLVFLQQLGLDGLNMLHHIFRGSVIIKTVLLGLGVWPIGIVPA